MTEPYYRDDHVTLYHGDCLEHREWLTADVLITDPPYGMGYISSYSKYGDTAPILGDGDTTLRDSALAAWGPKRAALVFGTWRAPRPAATLQVIVWDKGDSPGMGNLKLPWGPSHEDVYALGHTGWAGRRSPSVIRANTLSVADRRRPEHPTPKPVALMERLIASTVGTVADPFAGSGATLIAARNLGRLAVGVEIDERYCEIIAHGLAQQAFDFGDWDGESA